jgi:hypothetical protein
MVIANMINMSVEANSAKHPSHIKGTILVLSIPVVVMLMLVLAINVPKWLADPKYDFIYVSCETSCSQGGGYSVDETGLIEYANYSSDYGYESLKYYDVSRGASRSISYKEARKYQLSTFSKSPDGYTLEYEQAGSSGGFLFFNTYREGSWSLVNGWFSKKIDAYNYSRYNISFLGWVLNNEK